MKHSPSFFREKTPPLRIILFILLLVLPMAVSAAPQEDAAPEYTVTILYRGSTIHAASLGETVEQLLARLELEVDCQDTLSLPPETEVSRGMLLRVDRFLTQEQTYAVTIPREVVRCNDPARPRGTEEVLVPGSDGELVRTARVTYRNGLEVHREILREDVRIPPVSAVVARGTGNTEAQDAPGDLPRIQDGTITLPTGEVLRYTRVGTVRATAYTHTDAGCNMTTATGSTVHIGTVAVDPRFIPYNTRMFIMASDGSYIYGIAQAEDCGGDIIGDRVDLYLPTYEDCILFGRRECTVYYLG